MAELSHLFTEDEFLSIYQPALGRHLSKSTSQKKKPFLKSRGTDTALWYDFCGAAVEFYTARLCGVDLDRNIYHGGDGHLDLTIRGRTVDCKGTDVPGGRLIFDSMDVFRANYAILGIVRASIPPPLDLRHLVDGGEYQQVLLKVFLVGWTTRAHFEAHCHKGEVAKGQGPRLYLNQDELFPIETFPLFRERIQEILRQHPELRPGHLPPTTRFARV